MCEADRVPECDIVNSGRIYGHSGEAYGFHVYHFSVLQWPLEGQGLFIIEASRSYSDTTLGRTPLDK